MFKLFKNHRVIQELDLPKLLDASLGVITRHSSSGNVIAVSLRNGIHVSTITLYRNKKPWVYDTSIVTKNVQSMGISADGNTLAIGLAVNINRSIHYVLDIYRYLNAGTWFKDTRLDISNNIMRYIASPVHIDVNPDGTSILLTHGGYNHLHHYVCRQTLWDECVVPSTRYDITSNNNTIDRYNRLTRDTAYLLDTNDKKIKIIKIKNPLYRMFSKTHD